MKVVLFLFNFTFFELVNRVCQKRKKTMKNDCTILVISTDVNSDLWNPYFKLLVKFWDNLKYKVILSTQSSKYNCDDLEIENINSHNNVIWGQRVLECLDKISTEYVLLFLDDYFIKSEVKQTELDYYFKYMDNHKDVNCIYLNTLINNSNSKTDCEKLVELRKGERYSSNCQVGIWRKSKLAEIISPFENPWQLELFGGHRTIFFSGKYFCLSNEKFKPIDYCRYGLCKQGKLIKEEYDYLISNFEFINCDILKRGFFDENLTVFYRVKRKIIYIFIEILLQYKFFRYSKRKIRNL